jgi:ornithine decarboxylase
MSDRISKFFEATRPETPCVVIDLEKIKTNYDRMVYFFPWADIFYAVKANPNPNVLSALAVKGSAFDCASLEEIKLVTSLGVEATGISFGNTIKKERDIKAAYEMGVDLFAFDSQAELEKIARSAPGANVFCRILWEGGSAGWPLSKKFGCSKEMAVDLLAKADKMGLKSYGVSFHVGSQQLDPEQWYLAIGAVAEIFQTLKREGIELGMINIGGGLPIYYNGPIPDIQAYLDQIEDSMELHFGYEKSDWPRIIMEPGRSMAADSGIMFSEVVLISKKSDEPYGRTWVYLDAGKFHGLAETMDESIKYRIVTDYEADIDQMSVIIAGRTCDSADILYEKSEMRLSKRLKIGDIVRIMGAGSYTTSYASGARGSNGEVYGGFNGFPAPMEYVI